MLMMHYPDYEAFLKQYLLQMQKMKNGLVGLEQRVTDLYSNGVIAGDIHDELVIYQEYVHNGRMMADEIINTMKTMMENYLEDMNDAQRVKDDGEYILYPKDYKETRDYTAANFDKLERLCDKTDEDANVFEKILDFAEDFTGRIERFLGKVLNLFPLRLTQQYTMEINDVTRTRLRTIELRLNSRERSYTQKADSLRDVIVNLNAYLYNLTEMISWKNGEFKPSDWKNRMTNLYSHMEKLLEEVQVNKLTTPECIMRFLELEHPERFFKDSSDEIYAYLAELSQMDWYDWDGWMMIITQMFDIGSQRFKSLYDDLSYEAYLMDREMLQLLDEMASREVAYGEDTEESLSAFEQLLGLVEDYGEAWADHLNELRDENGKLLLDKRTKEYKVFKAFYESFGNAADILGNGQAICSFLAKYLADYEKNKEILDSLMAQTAEDSAMGESLARIAGVYDKSMESIVQDIVRQFLEDGMGSMQEMADSFFDVKIFKAVGWIEMGINVVGKITGISDKAEAQLHLLSLGYDQMNSARSAYEKSLAALQACKVTDENYEQCQTEFKHCFEYYRTTQKRMYEQMAVAEDGKKSSYYLYCAEELGDLSLANFEEFDLMTYDEFLSATGN